MLGTPVDVSLNIISVKPRGQEFQGGVMSPEVYLWSGVSYMTMAMNEFEKAVMN
jgi:hypothetical protein